MDGDWTNDDPLAAVNADLASRWPESRVAPDLDRELALMDLLGDPQHSAPVVHVAGTNGKTSTTRMIESLLRAAGLGTGMYLSPHLDSVRERICLGGEPLDAEVFAALHAETAPYVELVDARVGRMTGFEVLTGMAFAAFGDAPVDAMAIECGMGGTWDATNVVRPATCVLLPIALEHTEYLGDTLAAVAGEKAGIITAPVPVVSSAQHPEAEAVIAGVCAEAGAELSRYGVDFVLRGRDADDDGQVLDIQGLVGRYRDVRLRLRGLHQAENAVLAVAAAEAFLGGRELDPELVASGLSSASSPGRLEILRREPLVVGDAAHNPHGLSTTVATLPETLGVAQVIAVVAVLRDKDASSMLDVLHQVAPRVVVTGNSSPRAMPASDLAEVADQYWSDYQVDVEPSLADALDLAIAEADDACASGTPTAVFVTGSVVTVADARRLLGTQGS